MISDGPRAGPTRGRFTPALKKKKKKKSLRLVKSRFSERSCFLAAARRGRGGEFFSPFSVPPDAIPSPRDHGAAPRARRPLRGAAEARSDFRRAARGADSGQVYPS